MGTRKLFFAALAGALLLTAACSSSKPGASGSTPASKLSGAPILLGLMAPSQSNSLSEPWIAQGAKIAAAAVNAAGGIDGRPVKIDYCDDHGTAQGGAVC